MAKKLTQKQALNICDRNVRKLKRQGWTAEQLKSYRRGFFKKPSQQKDSTK